MPTLPARDTTPYVEHTDTLPNGTRLHALHNLTDAQVDLLRGLLRQHRGNLSILLNEAAASRSMHERWQVEANELDHLIMHLYPVRQPAEG